MKKKTKVRVAFAFVLLLALGSIGSGMYLLLKMRGLEFFGIVLLVIGIFFLALAIVFRSVAFTHGLFVLKEEAGT